MVNQIKIGPEIPFRESESLRRSIRLSQGPKVFNCIANTSREIGVLLSIPWKTGFEIELLAPLGRSRRDLAVYLAEAAGGTVRRVFSAQSELSEVPGMPVFENLTLAFDALDQNGILIARCADDLTIVSELDREAAPVEGWYRVVSDDIRFIRLMMIQCDAEAPHSQVLDPMSALFGTDTILNADGMIRLTDQMGASVAIAAPLPSERERPCELITPPIAESQGERLLTLLAAAAELDFTVPLEAAVHIHFDSGRLCRADVLSPLMRILHREDERLRHLIGTNPNCRRLGSMSEDLLVAISKPDFMGLEWPQAQAHLGALELTKYCNFNVLNMIHDTPDKRTFEVRILPGTMDAQAILRWGRLFAAILEWATAAPKSFPESDAFYAGLNLTQDDRDWLQL